LGACGQPAARDIPPATGHTVAVENAKPGTTDCMLTRADAAAGNVKTGALFTLYVLRRHVREAGIFKEQTMMREGAMVVGVLAVATALAAGLAVRTARAQGGSAGSAMLAGHAVVLDNDGRLLSWVQPQDAAYGTIVGRA
jgi:hypothetical protein